ncbi:MAG: hypothetical protein CR985_03210 [Flavobacteriales bacterium]|nr:MAG: hypothetical protein CR985_03210 [Flavobacteriales bacterium]
MKKEDVPQDKSNLESANFRELCYAVDEDGNYITANSTGWEPKTVALDNAIAVLKGRAAAAKEQVMAGVASPVVYYMEVCKMDLPTLAAYMNMWQWRVKRHFKPKVFKMLSRRIKRKYADVFNISMEELKNVEKHTWK